MGVEANSCPTNRSSGGCHRIWGPCCASQTAGFSRDSVFHAPQVLVFQGFCASCTQNEGFLWAFSKKNRRRKRLATPHANWSTCNVPKINFEQNKNCNCNCNCNLDNIWWENKKYVCKHFCANSKLFARLMGPATVVQRVL